MQAIRLSVSFPSTSNVQFIFRSSGFTRWNKCRFEGTAAGAAFSHPHHLGTFSVQRGWKPILSPPLQSCIYWISNTALFTLCFIGGKGLRFWRWKHQFVRDFASGNFPFSAGSNEIYSSNPHALSMESVASEAWKTRFPVQALLPWH